MRRPRARTLLAALVVAALGILAASRREPNATAKPHHPNRPGHARTHEQPRRARRPLAADSPWASRDACLLALKTGRAARDPGVARIGAWNLHWFPDGGPGRPRPDGGADLEWLACGIAWMHVDVLAVEEIKRPPEGEAGLATLRQKLDALTGGSWQSLLDDCPHASSQHVGLLYDARRVKLASSATVGALNPLGEPCKNQLRPGLAGYFRFPGGLDLSVVAAHLKSGADERGLTDRALSLDAFAGAAASVAQRTHDQDVLFIGDMNSMGCETCDPVVSSGAELTRLDAALARAGAPIARISAEPACSHHYGGQSILLDWAAKSDLSELPSERHVTVSGPCGELGCEDLTGELHYHRSLSDHCPIWLDVDDRDRD